jgi:hypothetical protein
MAEVLVLEFEGYGQDMYHAVHHELGLNHDWTEGEIPAGLISHVAGTSAAGLVVVEVWESQEAQADFNEKRLVSALQGAGVTSAPSRAEWLTGGAHHHPVG